jgi:DMSO/TMAO reductase YedYZ molybdopterin-dependent catalytic subunit
MKEIIVNDTQAKKYKRRSLIAFLIFFVMIGAAYASWHWLYNSPKDGGIRGGIQQPLRNVLSVNEKIFQSTFNQNKLIKEYPKSEAAKQVRANGDAGLSDDFDAETWKLQVIKNNGDTLYISMDELKQMPKTEVVFNFKCIEGWSQITWWGGVRFSDFAKKYDLNSETKMQYVGMMTPDEEYYVGIDMPSVLQPQTILCYEMNGAPLPMNQGYPLRLIIPVKYGVKHLKRIGTISFANSKPADYWAERGYDYYTGH